MTEGKLSEQLAQLGAVDEDGRHAHLCHKAREMEAEVGRLRERVRHMNQNATAREAALQDAVSDVRRLLARGPKYWAHVDEFYAIFDKLPDGEP